MAEANINQHIARVRIRDGLGVDASYILHVLGTPEYRRYFESIITGLAYPQISLRQVRDALVPLPPLQAQRDIASQLDSVDAAISRAASHLAELTAVRQVTADAIVHGRLRFRPEVGGTARA
jgi:type I restriction enzyme S subunit